MQFFTLTIVLALAMGISAASMKPTAQDYQQRCGNTGKLSCCNTESNPAAAGGLLALAGVDNLAGGSCQQIPINVIAIPISNDGDVCGSNQISCCESTSTNQLGLINLSTTCTPIDILG